jgi:hypothetical protein
VQLFVRCLVSARAAHVLAAEGSLARHERAQDMRAQRFRDQLQHAHRCAQGAARRAAAVEAERWREAQRAARQAVIATRRSHSMAVASHRRGEGPQREAAIFQRELAAHNAVHRSHRRASVQRAAAAEAVEQRQDEALFRRLHAKVLRRAAEGFDLYQLT